LNPLIAHRREEVKEKGEKEDKNLDFFSPHRVSRLKKATSSDRDKAREATFGGALGKLK
jgi:hypothetical protein